MKRTVFASFVIIMLSLVSVNFAFAIDLSEEQKTHIGETCVYAQSNLQRISNSDTTTRINRGRNYDQVLKLFYSMNTRVASNSITEPRLAETTKKFENELSSFRANYNSYNAQLKNTIDFGCTSQPQEFYNHLERTREERTKLNENIIKLNNLIEEYKSIIKEIST